MPASIASESAGKYSDSAASQTLLLTTGSRKCYKNLLGFKSSDENPVGRYFLIKDLTNLCQDDKESWNEITEACCCVIRKDASFSVEDLYDYNNNEHNTNEKSEFCDSSLPVCSNDSDSLVILPSEHPASTLNKFSDNFDSFHDRLHMPTAPSHCLCETKCTTDLYFNFPRETSPPVSRYLSETSPLFSNSDRPCEMCTPVSHSQSYRGTYQLISNSDSLCETCSPVIYSNNRGEIHAEYSECHCETEFSVVPFCNIPNGTEHHPVPAFERINKIQCCMTSVPSAPRNLYDKLLPYFLTILHPVKKTSSSAHWSVALTLCTSEYTLFFLQYFTVYVLVILVGTLECELTCISHLK